MGGNSSKEEEEIRPEEGDVNQLDDGDHFGPEFLPIHIPSVGSTFASILFSMLMVAIIYLAVRKCINRYGGRRGGGRRWNGDPELGYHGYHAYPFAGIEMQERHHYAPLQNYYAARPLPPVPWRPPLQALYAPATGPGDNGGRIYEMVGGDARATTSDDAGRRNEDQQLLEQQPAYSKAGRMKKLDLNEPPVMRM